MSELRDIPADDAQRVRDKAEAVRRAAYVEMVPLGLTADSTLAAFYDRIQNAVERKPGELAKPVKGSKR